MHGQLYCEVGYGLTFCGLSFLQNAPRADCESVSKFSIQQFLSFSYRSNLPSSSKLPTWSGFYFIPMSVIRVPLGLIITAKNIWYVSGLCQKYYNEAYRDEFEKPIL